MKFMEKNNKSCSKVAQRGLSGRISSDIKSTVALGWDRRSPFDETDVADLQLEMHHSATCLFSIVSSSKAPPIFTRREQSAARIY